MSKTFKRYNSNKDDGSSHFHKFVKSKEEQRSYKQIDKYLRTHGALDEILFQDDEYEPTSEK